MTPGESKIPLESILSGTGLIAAAAALLWALVKREFHRFEKELEEAVKATGELKAQLNRLEGEFSHTRRDTADANKSVTLLERSQQTCFQKLDVLTEKISKSSGMIQGILVKIERETEED
jgi:chromosome segregation ATPase